MRVDGRIILYALASLFVLAGLGAMLLRGNAWPFAMEDLNLPPHRVLIDELRLEAALEQETLSGEMISDLARAMVAKAPLAVYPFEGLLSVEVDRERLVPGSMDVEAADRYARAALDRDGRNLTARFYLLDKAIIDGDWDGALRQFGRAFTLWPEQQGELFFGLEQMLADPEMVNALIRASNDGVDWVPAFLRQASIDALEPDQVEQLYRPQPDAHPQLLTRYVRSGQFEQAYQFWSSLQPEAVAKFQHAVVDPAFEGSTLLPPFNWQFDEDFTERPIDQDVLQIFYRGRGRPVFASQITRLPAGSYAFRMDLDALPSADGGDFIWQIVCLTNDEFPLEVSIFDYADTALDDGVPFEISDGCPFQELSFRGYPGQFTRSANLQINQIQISRQEAGP